MFDGFKRSEIKTSGARIVTVTGGSGPPLLLMHGNPFTHLNWHKVAPTLAREFTVVATDLRGYGDSEKPPGGPDHSGYSFRAMAQDQIEVMAALGFDKFYAAGHDRGGRVLHRMCLDHPQKVVRAAILDIIPQHHLYNNINKQWATFSWHWFFNIQPFDLRGLPRRGRRRSGDGHKGFRRRPQDRMPRTSSMGCDRWCRAQSQSGPCGHLAALREQYRCRQSRPLRPLSGRRSAGRNHRGAARVLCRQINQIAVGAGMSRKPRTACQNKWRLIATATECAVFGKITSCLSPCGSCR